MVVRWSPHSTAATGLELAASDGMDDGMENAEPLGAVLHAAVAMAVTSAKASAVLRGVNPVAPSRPS